MKTDLRKLLAEKGLLLIDLADMLGVDRSSVTRWAQHGIPASRVLAVERATKISRKILRPDLYP